MPISKLRPSFTFTEDRLKALQAVVPEAFADGKINWDTLREALGERLEDETQEHFGLSWPGKREARQMAAMPSFGTLTPAQGLGVREDTTGNVYIEGENLEVLKLLQKSYSGKVKLIYIDPPYNTGRDFIYSDDFADPVKDYLRKVGAADDQGKLLTTNTRADGRYHSNWLNMMYPRLRLARSLLREDGAIFVSIDDNEVHNLRQIMNEIFGEENFITAIIWQKNYAPKSNAKYFSADHDYIVAYAKELAEWSPEMLPRTEAQNKIYKNPDNDLRGDWRPNNLAARNYYSKGMYSIVCPGGRVIDGPPKGSYWRISEERLWELHSQGRIWWGENGNNVPAPKIYMSEVKQGRVPQTLWFYKDVGHTQEAKKQLLDLVAFEDTDNVLDTVKPYRLIQKIVQISTEADTEDIVVDFFSGSSSSAHGVIAQNLEDSGNRKFIMVQFPEPLPKPEANLRTIADIGIQRIRSVIKECDDKESSSDAGFRVYRYTPSHFRSWSNYQGTDVQTVETLFDRFESPLVDGWKTENLLTEVMLIEGFPLDSHIRLHPNFTENQVYHVHSDFFEHDLYACFDRQLAPATLQKAAQYPNDIFICLDSALSDEDKLRLSDRCNLKVI